MASLKKQLEAMAKKLQPKIQDALKNEVAEVVTERMLANIKTSVYDAYPNPKLYERRYDDGGLADSGNIDTKIVGNTLVVENNTMSNEDYLPDGKSPYKIAGSIEYGTGYDYFNPGANYFNPGARPFVKNTREDLKQNKQHIKAFKDGLKRNGVDIE